MALLLAIALLSATGTLANSANKVTGCDRMPDNSTCDQYACDQPPCSILCGQSSSFDRCVQSCNGSSCNTMVCSSSVQNCQQNCPSGNCTDYECNAKLCFQNCDGGGNCGIMRCTNSGPGTSCEQSAGKELFCDSKTCMQNCNYRKCNMTCSSSVRDCTQNCRSGGCTYRCDAEKCTVDCPAGNCKKIESPTKPPGTGTGTRLQLVISLVPGLMLAMVVFM